MDHKYKPICDKSADKLVEVIAGQAASDFHLTAPVENFEILLNNVTSQ